MFDFKQRGAGLVGALNRFYPMGYSDSEQEIIRHSWILSCGRIPDQIFDEPHPECKPSASEVELDFRLNDASGDQILQIPDTSLADICCIAVDCRLSQKFRFLAVTLPTLFVIVDRLVFVKSVFSQVDGQSFQL
jgi:hypothetical protein